MRSGAARLEERAWRPLRSVAAPLEERRFADRRSGAALFLDKPRIVGEGLGAADPDFSEFRMQGIEEKVRFDMNDRTRNGQNGTCF